MAFTKQDAKILAEMLNPSAASALRFICGKGGENNAQAETIEGLEELQLIRITTADGKVLALLTPRGKKVAEFI